MFAIALAAVFPFLLVAAVRARLEVHERRPVATLLVAGYIARLAIQVFSRELRLFASGGADSGSYQANGDLIARLWTYSGIHYVTTDELPSLHRVTLPPNLYALIFYVNGESSRLGGTAVIALLACLTCLEAYKLAVELGAPRSAALKTTAFVLFMPTFLFYTSDLFKDGIVYYCEILILATSIRLSRKFSLSQLAVGLGSLLCVWLTRYYLCYVLPIPLLIGCLGPPSGSRLRALLAVLILAVAVGSVAAYTSIAGSAANDASETFEHGTSRGVVESNAETGGSGVTFDDGGSPFGSLPAKLLYTLFSPFPWQAGSIGLQLAKVEVLAWYYLAYRAVLAFKLLLRRRRTDLAILLAFIVPNTLVYAVMFANVGLNARERIAIIIASAVVATVSWRAPSEGTEEELGPAAVPTAS